MSSSSALEVYARHIVHVAADAGKSLLRGNGNVFAPARRVSGRFQVEPDIEPGKELGRGIGPRGRQHLRRPSRGPGTSGRPRAWARARRGRPAGSACGPLQATRPGRRTGNATPRSRRRGVHGPVRDEHVAAVAEPAGVVLRNAALPQFRGLVGNQPGKLIEPRHRLLDAPGPEVFNGPGHDVARALRRGSEQQGKQGGEHRGELSHDWTGGHQRARVGLWPRAGKVVSRAMASRFLLAAGAALVLAVDPARGRGSCASPRRSRQPRWTGSSLAGPPPRRGARSGWPSAARRCWPGPTAWPTSNTMCRTRPRRSSRPARWRSSSPPWRCCCSSSDGKLSLDDPARKYVPELPDYGAPLTIRHLLNHTSGLRDWGSVAGIAGAPRTTREYTHAHVLDIVSRQKSLNFPTGTQWSYTNTGFNLAAVIVSRVSGMSFAEFSQARIFTPLGMTRTSWRDDHTPGRQGPRHRLLERQRRLSPRHAVRERARQRRAAHDGRRPAEVERELRHAGGWRSRAGRPPSPPPARSTTAGRWTMRSACSSATIEGRGTSFTAARRPAIART